jgi:DNA-binding transcriptional MerR regulator
MTTPRSSWTIDELADAVGVPVRTIRYYIAEGMLPGPGSRGKGTSYTEDHLQRLRLIRRLVEQRVPLADVRQLVERLSPDETEQLLAEDERRSEQLQKLAQTPSPAAYVAGLLERARASRQGKPLPALPSPGVRPGGEQRKMPPAPSGGPPAAAVPAVAPSEEWQRYIVAPGLELHVRRDLLPRYRDIVERILDEHGMDRE